MKIFKHTFLPLLALGLLSLTGCGGSSSGGANGSAVGFAIPSGVDVMKVTNNTGSAYDDSGTDYSNAQQSFHVSHPVGEALQTTTQIMCFLGQLGIPQMWKESAIPRIYLVGVDQGKCDSGGKQPSQGAAAGGSSSDAPVLTMVTVRLSREATGSFPRAEIWFEESDNGQPGDLRASIDVLEEPSSANPYGKFNLYFAQSKNGSKAGGGNLIVAGTAAAPIAFTFYESNKDSGQTQTKAASVEMDADGSNLKAAVQVHSPWDGNQAWVVASNGTKIKANNKKANNATADSVTQVNLSGGVCLNTDSFKYRVNGYGLYNEGDGSKVELTTGFSCEYTDNSAKTRHCYVGSNGVWFEPQTDGSEHTVASGDHVTRKAWGNDAAHDGDPLTLFVADGRMRRYTVKEYTLAEIDGIEMRYFDNAGPTDYIIKYLLNGEDDGIGGTVGADGFYKVATMSWGMGGPPTKTDLGSSVQINIAANQYINFWSDNFGGVSFIGGSGSVTARLEELVMPGDAAFVGGKIDMKCLGRCPKDALTQVNLSTYAGPYVADPANVAGALPYTFKKADMTLHRGNLITSPLVGLDPAASPAVSFSDNTSVYRWGLDTGALVDITSATFASLTNLWDVYNTAGNVFYQYRMGANSFDKLIMAIDDGTSLPLQFDQPLNFDYTHLTANDRNADATFNNKKFLLRFQGEGHIDGFPYEEVDRDGDTATTNDKMWFPLVSLKDNVQLTENGHNYRIKALYGDLTLESVACGSSLSLHLPDVSIPSGLSGSPSNVGDAKPSHGTCEFDTVSQAASAGCN